MGLPYTLEPYVQYVHINSFGNQGTTQLIVPDVFIVVGIPSMVFNNPIDIFVMNDVSRSKKNAHALLHTIYITHAHFFYNL